MSKYAPLGEFLRAQQTSEVPVTFSDIERIIGASLPASSKYPAWWSNNPSNNVMTDIWLKAGFQTERVDTPAKRLVFRRKRGFASPSGAVSPNADGGKAARRHPIFGCMKGTITIAPGVDLTEPADPSWGAAD